MFSLFKVQLSSIPQTIRIPPRSINQLSQMAYSLKALYSIRTKYVCNLKALFFYFLPNYQKFINYQPDCLKDEVFSKQQLPLKY